MEVAGRSRLKQVVSIFIFITAVVRDLSAVGYGASRACLDQFISDFEL